MNKASDNSNDLSINDGGIYGLIRFVLRALCDRGGWTTSDHRALLIQGHNSAPSATRVPGDSNARLRTVAHNNRSRSRTPRSNSLINS